MRTLFSFILFSCVSTASQPRMFEKNDPVVFLGMTRGVCSAVFVADDLLITAAHCVNREAPTLNLIALGKTSVLPYTIVDITEDVGFNARFGDGFSLLRLHKVGRFSYGKNFAKIAESVEGTLTLRCYPVIGNESIPIITKVKTYKVQRLQGKKLIITPNISRGGCSGGGLFNLKNELVGLTIWGVGLRGVNSLSVFYDVTQYKHRLDGSIKGLN